MKVVRLLYCVYTLITFCLMRPITNYTYNIFTVAYTDLTDFIIYIINHHQCP